MAENSCYTYFKIVGDFDPDTVGELEMPAAMGHCTIFHYGSLGAVIGTMS